MDKNLLIKFCFVTFLATSSAAIASPAMEDDNSNYSTTVEEAPLTEMDARPAMEDKVAEPAPMAADMEESMDAPEMTTETQVSGDSLALPEAGPAMAVAVRTLDFPTRGMSQDKVQNELGRPGEIIPAVGEPPISRWVYDDRVVYFERSAVIHVVAK